MVRITKGYWHRGFAAAALVAAGLVLSGCAYTMGEFSRTAQTPAQGPVVKEAVLEDGAVPLKPAALVEVEPLPSAVVAPAGAATATVLHQSGYPNLNVVPPPSKSKLLTPEEKAKVIAELEGLARKQGATMAKEHAATDAVCNGLTAEELRKRMLQGQC